MEGLSVWWTNEVTSSREKRGENPKSRLNSNHKGGPAESGAQRRRNIEKRKR